MNTVSILALETAENFINGNLNAVYNVLRCYQGIDASVMTITVRNALPPKTKEDFDLWVLKFQKQGEIRLYL